MKITIEWSEEVLYTSVVEVDDDALRDFLDKENVEPGVEPTLANVKDFLESGDEEDWFTDCDAALDFTAVQDRSLDGVTSLNER